MRRSPFRAWASKGPWYRKLRSTNGIENLNSGITAYSKNVKRWQGGSMVVRWVSAAIVEAREEIPSRAGLARHR